MQVKIVTEYENENQAKIVADVLEADNKTAPNHLSVSSSYKENVVYSEIKTPKIETLIATVDDLLSSQKLAEDILGDS